MKSFAEPIPSNFLRWFKKNGPRILDLMREEGIRQGLTFDLGITVKANGTVDVPVPDLCSTPDGKHIANPDMLKTWVQATHDVMMGEWTNTFAGMRHQLSATLNEFRKDHPEEGALLAKAFKHDPAKKAFEFRPSKNGSATDAALRAFRKWSAINSPPTP